MLSERFGFLLAENLDKVGSSKSVNSENIGMKYTYVATICICGNNFVVFVVSQNP